MRRAVVAAGLGVALAAGAAAAVTVPSVSVAAPAFSGVAVTTVPEYGARGTHVVDYRHGHVLRLALPVTNTGRAPLAVTGADFGEGPLALLTVRDVADVKVPAGATRTVVVEALLGNCKYFHERETQTYDGLTLSVSSLGRSADRVVSLDRPLLVHSPMIVGCPDRMLNRQANDRRDASIRG